MRSTIENIGIAVAALEVATVEIKGPALTPAGQFLGTLLMAGVAAVLIAWLFHRLRKEGEDRAYTTLRSGAYAANLDGASVLILPATEDAISKLDRGAVYKHPLTRAVKP